MENEPAIEGGGAIAAEPRRFAARLGIVALNLLNPGLGLVRLGELRRGLSFMLATPVLLLLVAAIAAVAQTPGFATVATIVIALLLINAVLYIASCVLSWRWSRGRSPLRWWSRWHGMLGLELVFILIAHGAVRLVHLSYKPFYAASVSMEPTIRKNDRILVEMRGGWPVGRGKVILVRVDDGVRITRIGAVGGDLVEVRDGVLVINGHPVRQTPAGMMTVLQPPGRARLFTERLPGERSSHVVADMGASTLDFFGPIRVPPGHVFVIGDNRDQAADSRIPPELDGMGMIPLGAIIGHPLFISLSRDPARWGTTF